MKAGDLVKMSGTGWDSNPIGIIMDVEEDYDTDSLKMISVIWSDRGVEDVFKKWLEKVA